VRNGCLQTDPFKLPLHERSTRAAYKLRAITDTHQASKQLTNLICTAFSCSFFENDFYYSVYFVTARRRWWVWVGWELVRSLNPAAVEPLTALQAETTSSGYLPTSSDKPAFATAKMRTLQEVSFWCSKVIVLRQTMNLPH
jgi:hypothetical protein